MVKNIIIGILSFVLIAETVGLIVTISDLYNDKSPDSVLVSNNNLSVSLGDDNVFTNDELIYTSDKQDVYYYEGCYYLVSDSIIKQTETNIVVPRTISIIDYLNTYDGFSQSNATITCYSMEGSVIKQDLSMPWEKCSFSSLVAYWKTNDNKGILLQLSPDNTAILSEYLYYSDMQSLIDGNSNSY